MITITIIILLFRVPPPSLRTEVLYESAAAVYFVVVKEGGAEAACRVVKDFPENETESVTLARPAGGVVARSFRLLTLACSPTCPLG